MRHVVQMALPVQARKIQTMFSQAMILGVGPRSCRHGHDLMLHVLVKGNLPSFPGHSELWLLPADKCVERTTLRPLTSEPLVAVFDMVLHGCLCQLVSFSAQRRCGWCM